MQTASRPSASAEERRAPPSDAASNRRPNWRAIRSSAIAFGLPVIAAAGISQTWFAGHRFIAQGDIAPFIRTSVGPEAGWLWNHELTAAGSRSYEIVLWSDLAVLRVAALFGGGEVAAQRLFYAGLLALVALGGCLFARCFTKRPTAVAAAGIFCIVNPVILTQLPNPMVMASLAVMGYMGAIVLMLGQGKRIHPAVIGLATVGSAYLVNNIPLLVVAVAWVVALIALSPLLAGRGALRRVLVGLLRAAPWAVLLNLWWVVPVAMTFTSHGGPGIAVSSDVSTWSWTHARGSFSNLLALNGVWSWAHAEYFPYARHLDRPAWGWLRFMPALAAFSAPAIVKRRHMVTASVLLGLSLLAVVLSKGLHPPAPGLNLWLYHHVPGLWLFREPMTKFGPVIVLLFAALIALLCAEIADRVADRTRSRWMPAAAVAGIALVVVAYPYPIWNGTLLSGDRGALPSPRVQVPEAWRAVARALDGRGRDAKTIVLPLDDYYQMPTSWGYYGTDVIPRALVKRPVIQPVPQVYFSESEAFKATVARLQDDVLKGDGASLDADLRALGADTIVLRKDLDLTYPGRTFADPDALSTALAGNAAVRRVNKSAVADVYETVSPNTGLVHAAAADRGAGSAETGGLLVTEHGPARYTVDLRGWQAGDTVVLSESFDPGWKISGLPHGVHAEHVRMDGYANGWKIPIGGDFHVTLMYAPARTARRALLASLVTVLAAVGALGWSCFKMARYRLSRRVAADGSPPM